MRAGNWRLQATRSAVTSRRLLALRSVGPITRLATLVSDRIYLRATDIIHCVHQRVWKTIEVVDAQTSIQVWPTLLVLYDEIAGTLVLSKKRRGDCGGGIRCVVHRSVAKFCLSVWMDPVGHAMRARTLASASSPRTIATLPDLTSACRRSASSNHARWAEDLGSKLAIRRSRRRARSSGGRPRTWASRSCTGVDIGTPACIIRHSLRMPQVRGVRCRRGSWSGSRSNPTLPCRPCRRPGSAPPGSGLASSPDPGGKRQDLTPSA